MISVSIGALPVPPVPIGSVQGVEQVVLAETAVEGKRAVFPLWLHPDGGVKGKITGSGRFKISLRGKKVSGTGSVEFPKVKSGRMDLVLVPEEPATIERIELSGTGIMGT